MPVANVVILSSGKLKSESSAVSSRFILFPLYICFLYSRLRITTFHSSSFEEKDFQKTSSIN